MVVHIGLQGAWCPAGAAAGDRLHRVCSGCTIAVIVLAWLAGGAQPTLRVTPAPGCGRAVPTPAAPVVSVPPPLSRFLPHCCFLLSSALISSFCSWKSLGGLAQHPFQAPFTGPCRWVGVSWDAPSLPGVSDPRHGIWFLMAAPQPRVRGTQPSGQ